MFRLESFHWKNFSIRKDSVMESLRFIANLKIDWITSRCANGQSASKSDSQSASVTSLPGIARRHLIEALYQSISLKHPKHLIEASWAQCVYVWGSVYKPSEVVMQIQHLRSIELHSCTFSSSESLQVSCQLKISQKVVSWMCTTEGLDYEELLLARISIRNWKFGGYYPDANTRSQTKRYGKLGNVLKV